MKYMIIKTIVIGFYLMVLGCTRSPVEPLPPVVNQPPTFEQHLEVLKTPGHVHFWMEEFTSYNHTGQLGWDWLERGMPDLAYSLAYSLWETTLNFRNIGVCGQFAATYVVAARIHGYDSGFMITYSQDLDGSNVSGHAQGWILYNDTIYITSNQFMSKSNYTTKEELFKSFGELWFDNPRGYGWITDNKLDVIYDKDGLHTGFPTAIHDLPREQQGVILKVLGIRRNK